jgi:hypothetical protein
MSLGFFYCYFTSLSTVKGLLWLNKIAIVLDKVFFLQGSSLISVSSQMVGDIISGENYRLFSQLKFRFLVDFLRLGPALRYDTLASTKSGVDLSLVSITLV